MFPNATVLLAIFLLLMTAANNASAALVNRTIDDTDKRINYQGTWTNTTCRTCIINDPDTSQAFGNTWHYALANQQSVEFEFTGAYYECLASSLR